MLEVPLLPTTQKVLVSKNLKKRKSTAIDISIVKSKLIKQGHQILTPSISVRDLSIFSFPLQRVSPYHGRLQQPLARRTLAEVSCSFNDFSSVIYSQ